MIDDTTLDSIAERIFREADGDRSRAYAYPNSDYATIYNRVIQKFAVIEKAAADCIYAETAGDLDRALQLSWEFAPASRYEISHLLHQKFRAADDEAADTVAARCHREANGDRRLGYRLVSDYAVDRDRSFIANVRNG
jgi:hypothetical protein